MEDPMSGVWDLIQSSKQGNTLAISSAVLTWSSSSIGPGSVVHQNIGDQML